MIKKKPQGFFFYVVIEKTEKEIFLVALVIKFESNFITGKFETKAQI